MVRILFVATLLASALGAAPFSSLYFFGDSLSDTGNIYRATSLLNNATLGLFPIQPASPPYSNGRFSNGPLWAEQVATWLGHTGTAQSAGMSLGPLGSLSGTGNNYAIGGARTGQGGALGPFDDLVPTGINAQTDYYLSRTGGTADANALYFILGGGNDLRDMAGITDVSARNAAAITAAGNLANSVIDLYSAGARNFFLINGPNIGFVPESIADGNIQNGIAASATFNYVLDAYRGALSGLPGIDVMHFDLFSLYNDIVIDTVTNSGAEYGFTTLTPCIGTSNCTNSMFFDELHPTTRVHTLVGNRIADQLQGTMLLSLNSEAGLTPNPEPSTMIAGFAVAAFVARRIVAERRQRTSRAS